MFAYSLLYPLTDNLLDDPAASSGAKRGFSAWLTDRLQDRPALPIHTESRAIDRLLGMGRPNRHAEVRKAVTPFA